MTPQEALARQIECYRQMTGEERLKIALNLHRLVCEVAMEGIRHQFPDADEAAVQRELRRRIELGRLLGDGGRWRRFGV
jgi:hypothetical protein